MIKDAIQQVVAGKDLSYQKTAAAINEIMTGQVSDIQIAAFLTALTAKGETIDEIAGAAAAMRSQALKFKKPAKPSLEIVGTGGDQAHTFNISTTSAFIAAAAGIPVTKHGNRAASSLSGAADVLESLGADINSSPQNSAKILAQTGICFLYAQEYHQAMRYVASARKELAFRTLFNILGPLANPAGASMQLLGVYDEHLLELLPEVLQKLGVMSGMVVHGCDGLDEITLTGPTKIVAFRDGNFEKFEIEPEQFGLQRCQPSDLVGGTPAENATITRKILGGKLGPKRDVVLLNAAAAIQIAQPELTLSAAFDRATKILDSGQALTKLNEFIAATNCDVDVA